MNAALWAARALAVAAAALALRGRELSPAPAALLFAALLVRAAPPLLRGDVAPARPARPGRALALAFAAAALAALLAYGGAIGRGYYFFIGQEQVDFDAMNLVHMDRPPPGWESLPRAVHNQGNRFLPELTHELDRFAPRAVHGLNLALWVGASFALGALALRLTGSAGAGALAAAVGALTPSQVGTVLWVHGRQDLTATCLILGALAFYAWALRDGRAARPLYGLALGSAALASVSKETALVAPLLLIGLEALLARPRAPLRSALRLAPFLALAAVQAYFSFVVFAFQSGELAKASLAVALDAAGRQLPYRFFAVELHDRLWGLFPATVFLVCAAGATRREARTDRALAFLVAALVALAPTHHLLNYPKHIVLPALLLMAGASALAVSGGGRWNAARSAVLAAALLFACARETRAGVETWLRKNARADAVLAGFEAIRRDAPAGARFLFLPSRNAELMVNLLYRPQDRDAGFTIARVNADGRFEWAGLRGVPYLDRSRPFRLDELDLFGRDVVLAPTRPDGALLALNERLRALRAPLAPDAETREAAGHLADPRGWTFEGPRPTVARHDAEALRVEPAPRYVTFLGPEVRVEPRAVRAIEALLALAPDAAPDAAGAYALRGPPVEGIALSWTTETPGALETARTLEAAPAADGAARAYRFEVADSPVWLAGGAVTRITVALQRESAWAEFRGLRLILRDEAPPPE